MPITSPGSGTRCAIRLGVTKMPEPMTEPTSSAAPSKKLSFRGSSAMDSVQSTGASDNRRALGWRVFTESSDKHDGDDDGEDERQDPEGLPAIERGRACRSEHDRVEHAARRQR